MKNIILATVILFFSSGTLAGLPRVSEAGSNLNGVGRFIISSTGATFVPRGNNYIRENGGLHSLFSPGAYDPLEVESAMTDMEGYGYNIVRVFIEQWPATNASVGLPMTEGGLNEAYLDNVADLISRAGNHNIYVMIVLSGFPVNSYYQGIANSYVTASGYYGGGSFNYNSLYMNLGHIMAKAQYVEDFVVAIESRIGVSNLTNIFSYEIDNELFFDVGSFPFSSTTGVISAANGLSYDMSSSLERQQAADASVVEYATRVTNSLKSVDPDAMVSIGVFTYNAIGLSSGPDGLWPGTTSDWRRPGRPASITQYSNIDFIDIHHYPLGAYTLSADLSSSEYSLVYGPVLMGEFGAFSSQYPTVASAAIGMRDLQIDSCGFNTAGWVFWTFDTTTQPGLYNVVQNFGAINGQLAPGARPNPCVP